MDMIRERWKTPGRQDYEVEAEARYEFRKTYGRPPNLDPTMNPSPLPPHGSSPP